MTRTWIRSFVIAATCAVVAGVQADQAPQQQAPSQPWVYAASGDIIDAQTKTIITSLKDELGREVQGEKVVEVLYQDGKLIKTVDQFGVGQVRGTN